MPCRTGFVDCVPELVGVLVGRQQDLDDALDGRHGQVRIDRQRGDRARRRLDHRQIAGLLTVEGPLPVHRRVEVLAGVDAFGEQREREAVADQAELLGVDADREVLERARVDAATAWNSMPGTSSR